MKVRVKIFDRELEAEGDEAFVSQQFGDFVNELKAEFDAITRRNREREFLLASLRPQESRLLGKLAIIREQMAKA